MKQHPAWGVDVTSVAVRGVKLALGEDAKPRLIAWDLVDYAEDVEDLGAVARYGVMSRGLFHFLSRHALKRSRVFTSLRAETAFNRTVVVPPVNDESLDRILEYEAQQQVPFPLPDVFWDRRVLAIREDGAVLATIYAVRKSLVEERLRKFEKARFPVDGIQLRAIALQNFCAYERLLEQGTIVVDVDYNGLQVLIHHDEQTWFMVLPVGGVDLVQRIKETFNVPHRTAVRIATGDDDAPDEEILEACRREVAQDIVDETARTVRYYLAARQNVVPSGVVLFESHRAVPSLAAAVKRSFSLPVFKPKGFHHITVDPDVVTVGIQENFPGLVKAVGLGLQGIGKAEVAIRLYPENLQRNIDSRRVGYIGAAACLVLILALAALRFGERAKTVEEATQQLVALEAEVMTRDQVTGKVAFREGTNHLAALADAVKDLDGPRSRVEWLYQTAGSWKEGRVPGFASLHVGRTDPEKAELVLVLDQRESENSLAVLDGFAQRFKVAGGPVKEVLGGESWVAGSVTSEAPKTTPEQELMRYRMQHRKYVLSFGGAR